MSSANAATPVPSTPISSIPGVGKPCERALNAAGYPDLESLASARYAELLSLHGVGAKGLERIALALGDRGLALAGEGAPALSSAPLDAARTATVTAGHTGVTGRDVKTAPTDVDPRHFIEGLPWPRRVAHGKVLLELFARATGEEPVMWGDSMVGYGACHYTYATGREGDWFIVGFSPRKAKLSLYGIGGEKELVARLGKHTAGASCVYVNKLEDIELGVLEEAVARAYAAVRESGSGAE